MTNHKYYRLSLASDTTGKFHHYEVWSAIKGRTAFLQHVCDLLPGTHVDTAYAFLNILVAINDL
jgi:hypothetical protein